MDPARLNPLDLLLEVIHENTPNSIWTGAPLAPFRVVANTNRGDIGEEFLRRYLERHDIGVVQSISRIDAADMLIKDKLFEVKTASEDSKHRFQFNHIRLDRKYDYLLCLGDPARRASVQRLDQGRSRRGAGGQASTDGRGAKRYPQADEAPCQHAAN